MDTIRVLPPLLASQHNLTLGLLQWSSEQFSVLCPHNQPELSLKSSFRIPLLICLDSSNGFPRHLKRNLSSLPGPIQASSPVNFCIACLLCSKHIGLLPVSLSSQALFYLQVFAFVVLSPYMCFLWCFPCLAPPTDLKSELKVTLENPSWLCCTFYFELMCALSHSVCLTLCDLQASLSMGILQTRILERVAFPPPGDLSNPGIKPRSPALQVDSLLSEPPGKPLLLPYFLSNHFTFLKYCKLIYGLKLSWFICLSY